MRVLSIFKTFGWQ